MLVYSFVLLDRLPTYVKVPFISMLTIQIQVVCRVKLNLATVLVCPVSSFVRCKIISIEGGTQKYLQFILELTV